MIQLSDYVINFLEEKGIKDIFLVSGGGIMYLCDAVGRSGKIRYICNHHEQACATAAESYARLKNSPGVCLVTTGPGGTNAITGVAGAFVDSIPLMVISGQVKREIISDYKKLRQLGPQEINIVEMVKPITKYATTVMKPERIRYEMEKGWFLASSERPGPVWIDIPLDVQSSMIDEKKLTSYYPDHHEIPNLPLLRKQVNIAVSLLKRSKRPVILAGNGIRLAGGIDSLKSLIKEMKIPVLHHINSVDILADDHPLNLGIYGPYGQRRANFILQNSDLVIGIGASLNISSTGFNYRGFAPYARKIMVNIDPGELYKKTLDIDLKIQADARDFLELLSESIKTGSSDISSSDFSPRWLKACEYWKNKYPIILPEFFLDKNHVHNYVFMDILSEYLSTEDILVSGIGSEAAGLYTAFKVKNGQRAYVNKNLGQMGWCLPGAIGACIGNRRKRTILVTGDGGFQFNIQELAVIKHHKLPVKIFIMNNSGYQSIKNTQNNLFSGRLVGADKTSGVSFPDYKSLAAAYSLEYGYIRTNSDIEKQLKRALSCPGPVLYEVNINPNQSKIPRSQTVRQKDGTLVSSTLENMFPFLPEKEVYDNMHMFDEET